MSITSSQPSALNTAGRGWDSDFRAFEQASPARVVHRIQDFVGIHSPSEYRSWTSTVPHLQREVGEVVRYDGAAGGYTAVLEYQLPLEARRIDAVFLLHDGVAVIELKGKAAATAADIDQAHAYARDLANYHRDCHQRRVVPILVPTDMQGPVQRTGHVHVCPPHRLDELLAAVDSKSRPDRMEPERFLSADAYRPLPSLIQAARALFHSRRVPRLWRSLANTDAVVDVIHDIIREAAVTRTRRLVLVTGVPGAGKTLVGLRIAHSEEPDRLASRDAPSSAIFLSGNGPLVQVLQYQLKSAGGGGRAFVRSVKDYVRTYGRAGGSVPDHHVIVFDEAQRAFDAPKVADTHKLPLAQAKSEPQAFVAIAERLPDWCVVIGLIGSGQEIHVGEEAGIGQWADAVRGTGDAGLWTVHGPPGIQSEFSDLQFRADQNLSLDTALRAHLAADLDLFVDGLVNAEEPKDAARLSQLAGRLEQNGHHLRLCRDLRVGKAYLRDRYADQPDKQFGLMTSSRDKALSRSVPEHQRFDADFRWRSQARLLAPWYVEAEEHPGSCRHLLRSITEFEAQGLELDGVLLGWGTDFVRSGGAWDMSRMTRYQKGRGQARVRHPGQLRANAYRVLLTRARDVTVVYVPDLPESEATAAFLERVGFQPL